MCDKTIYYRFIKLELSPVSRKHFIETKPSVIITIKNTHILMLTFAQKILMKYNTDEKVCELS